MDYPQHEKLKKVADAHQWCSEFYEYLVTHADLAEENAERLLSGFFRIDFDAFKEEEREIMAAAQAPRAPSTSIDGNA